MGSQQQFLRSETDKSGVCKCIDYNKPIPQHVAIIPDGNRRWARHNGLTVYEGHWEGYERGKEIVNALWDIGVKYVTFYSLSRENCMRRSREELENLFKLLSTAVDELLEDKRVATGYVRLFFVGDFSLLPSWIRAKIIDASNRTLNNGPYVFTLAVCYNGQWEIVETVRELLLRCDAIHVKNIDEEYLRRLLPLGWLPEPELVIRTGGEHRLSGFLLYHIAYSELYFSNKLWPDFSVEDLCEAICSFQKRERRFGK